MTDNLCKMFQFLCACLLLLSSVFARYHFFFLFLYFTSGKNKYFQCRIYLRLLPQAEYTALHDLYDSTQGENWKWGNSSIYGNVWEFSDSADPCMDDWQGVTCDENNPALPGMHVIELDLERYNLRGFLPDSLGDLGMDNGMFSINMFRILLTECSLLLLFFFFWSQWGCSIYRSQRTESPELFPTASRT